MQVEQLRQKLNDTIFRNRRQPRVNEITTAQSLENVGVLDVHHGLVQAGGGKIMDGKCCCVQGKDETFWERVKLALDDESEPSQTDLNLLLVRKEVLLPPYRTVVLLHGTGKSSTTCEMILHAMRFVTKDFMVVLLNSRYHGCRAGDGLAGKERYVAELVKAWQNNASTGKSPRYPFIYDTSADLASVADYLLSRADISPQSLGIAGISLGGMHAWFASAADERWKAVAPLIGVQSFKYAVDNECFHARVDTIQDVFHVAACDEEHESVTSATVRAVWNRICPGLLDHFDAESSLPLLFPRPVFVGNGELDPRCPIEGVYAAVESATETCLKIWGNKGQLELHVYPDVGHEVTEEMWTDCVEFFARVFSLGSSSEDTESTSPIRPC